MKLNVDRSLKKTSDVPQLVAYNCKLCYCVAEQNHEAYIDGAPTSDDLNGCIQFTMMAPDNWEAPEDGDIYDIKELFDGKVLISNLPGNIQMTNDETEYDITFNIISGIEYNTLTSANGSITTFPDAQDRQTGIGGTVLLSAEKDEASSDNAYTYTKLDLSGYSLTVNQDNFRVCSVTPQNKFGFGR